MWVTRLGLVSTGLMMAALAGCSGGSEGPSAVMMPDAQCAQLRNDLNAMDRRGVPGLIDAKTNGRGSFTPQQTADINRYNQVLDSYLGGKCASDQRSKSAGGASVTTGSIKRKASATVPQ